MQMCVERMRSIILAIIIGLAMGSAADSMQVAFIIFLVLLVALLIDGFLGFCPIRAVLKNVLPKCEEK